MWVCELIMRYDIQDSPLGPIVAVKDDTGLRYLSFQQGNHPLSLDAEWKKDQRALKNTFDQIQAYFAGELFAFDLPLAPMGSSFQQSVWKALMEIPYGQTASYGNIAEAIGNPRACRAVGGANGKNPIALIIPCHRVIGTNGNLVGYGGGLKLKAALLKFEALNT